MFGGNNSPIAPMSKPNRWSDGNLPRYQPSIANDNTHRPDKACTAEIMVNHNGPTNSKDGLYTKIKGARYLAMPTLVDSTAVAMGGVLAMAAAAKDANATGGVMVETTPK